MKLDKKLIIKMVQEAINKYAKDYGRVYTRDELDLEDNEDVADVMQQKFLKHYTGMDKKDIPKRSKDQGDKFLNPGEISRLDPINRARRVAKYRKDQEKLNLDREKWQRSPEAIQKTKDAKIAALYVQQNGAYDKDDPEIDAYHYNRNAMKFKGDQPVVAHPPCQR
jgi:hypothetical protein